ncbi:ABC1 family-domain-containing protein [Obelidium mucronatum]|nr:ABC1 family-domain-containing protein [Obelidium mucronatum]
MNTLQNQLKQQDDLDNGERVDELWSLVHRRSAQRMLKVFEENGGVYIKLGQHLNALVYLLPFEYTDTFKVLQDQCPPTPMKDVKQLIKDETGRDLEDLFTNFQEEPIGVASLAQVHKATLKSTNAPIAIKIQHPHLQAHAPIDTALCMYVVRAIKRVFPEFELSWLADEMAVSLPQELDFTMEANHLTTVRTNFRGDTVFFVPNVYWSTRRILVEEFVEGVKVDNLPGLHHINVDPFRRFRSPFTRVFENAVLGWVKPWYQIPVLDKWVLGMNPYNFELVLLDHGLYRSLSSKLRLDFCHLWTSLIRFDEAAIKKYTRRIFQNPSLTHPGGSGGDSGDDGAGGGESGDSLLTRLESIDPSIDPHRLFASMLTGRPWHVISRAQKDADEIGEKLTDQTVSTISVDITGGSSGGLISLRSNNEKTTIKNKFSKRKFLSALTKIMAVLPREVLLIIKTNDILRSVDRQLGVAGGTFLNSGSSSSTGDSEAEEEGDCLSHDRQEVVGNRMVRRFGWMVYYCSVAIRNERMREAHSLRAIADAWIDCLGILIRLVALETLTK